MHNITRKQQSKQPKTTSDFKKKTKLKVNVKERYRSEAINRHKTITWVVQVVNYYYVTEKKINI